MKNILDIDLSILAQQQGFDGDPATIGGNYNREDVIAWLEKQGMYINLMADLLTESENWNWQVQWRLPEDKWTYTDVENEDGTISKIVTNVSEGTGWYGDNGEFPQRLVAIDTAIKVAILKLNPLYRNNSVNGLAKLYKLPMNEFMLKIRPFADELGDFSFHELSRTQIDVIVSKLGSPFNDGN